MNVNINILINQTVKNRDVAEKLQDSFLENFNGADPYFMDDDLPQDDNAISVLKSECAVTQYNFDGNFFTRSIAAKIFLKVEDWPGLKDSLAESECFDDDGEFDAARFANLYLGEWEYVLVEVGDDEFEELSIERSDVSGDITVE
jgi:hypothetical protein